MALTEKDFENEAKKNERKESSDPIKKATEDMLTSYLNGREEIIQKIREKISEENDIGKLFDLKKSLNNAVVSEDDGDFFERIGILIKNILDFKKSFTKKE